IRAVQGPLDVRHPNKLRESRSLSTLTHGLPLQSVIRLVQVQELGQRLLHLTEVSPSDREHSGLEQVADVFSAVVRIPGEQLVVVRVLACNLIPPTFQNVEAQSRVSLSQGLLRLRGFQKANPDLLNDVIRLNNSRPVTSNVVRCTLDLFLELDHFSPRYLVECQTWEVAPSAVNVLPLMRAGVACT